MVDDCDFAGDFPRFQPEAECFDRGADAVAKGFAGCGGKGVGIEGEIVAAGQAGAVCDRDAPHSAEIAGELGHPDVGEDDVPMVVNKAEYLVAAFGRFHVRRLFALCQRDSGFFFRLVMDGEPESVFEKRHEHGAAFAGAISVAALASMS